MTYIYMMGRIVSVSLVVGALAVPFLVNAGLLATIFDTVSVSSVQAEEFSNDASAQTIPLLRAALNTDPNLAKGGGDIMVSDGALVPAGDIDGKTDSINTKTVNGEISLYVVREGDTLSQIAEMFDINSKTILWANDIGSPSKIRPGDSLIILPITGVRHVVKKGDTLASIAKKYDGDVDDILAYNQLASSEDVSIGDTIVVPGGMITTPAPTKKSSGKTSGKVATGNGSAGYTHPVPGAVRTQGIHGYNGVDYGATVGTPILAAASGEVIVAKTTGYNGGYGLYVVIKHANGTQTLYGHLSKVSVAVGDSVSGGETIGLLGNTGRSTGPHLHFEVRGARNPF